MAKRIMINWKQEGVEKTFLEACVHQITVNGREGSSLKQASWKTVAENLKTQHNFIVEQRQMKNHYDFLKGKFAAWLKLKNKTGNVYDPVTNSFNLSEEEWQIEMKLETLGWDESDAKYETALLLFGESADLRKLWVRLKPQNCEKWVKNAGAKYGLCYVMDVMFRMLCFGCYVMDVMFWMLCFGCYVMDNTMFHEMQSGENDGLLVQDIEWGSQGIDYMTSLRNQIANQLLSNESN
ncbi:putative Myb/SANT-like domain-containing protein [Helianthus annuus]|nr:putative Myb/SANT-like domain-containing protein [Helianthus annuus]KAJ0530401.1 putative Myb/SANT-like domain-containing protein [Helianthus annuus]